MRGFWLGINVFDLKESGVSKLISRGLIRKEAVDDMWLAGRYDPIRDGAERLGEARLPVIRECFVGADMEGKLKIWNGVYPKCYHHASECLFENLTFLLETRSLPEMYTKAKMGVFDDPFGNVERLFQYFIDKRFTLPCCVPIATEALDYAYVLYKQKGRPAEVTNSIAYAASRDCRHDILEDMSVNGDSAEEGRSQASIGNTFRTGCSLCLKFILKIVTENFDAHYIHNATMEQLSIIQEREQKVGRNLFLPDDLLSHAEVLPDSYGAKLKRVQQFRHLRYPSVISDIEQTFVTYHEMNLYRETAACDAAYF